MDLNSSINKLPGIGPVFAKKLGKLGVKTIKDLLYHIPYRYEDYSNVYKMEAITEGGTVTFNGQILDIKNIYTRYGKKIQKASVSDGESILSATWFNQPFLVKTLPPGTLVSLSGKIRKEGNKVSLTSPQYERLAGKQEPLHTGRIVPIYPETAGINSKWLRATISSIFANKALKIKEVLPEKIRQAHKLLSLGQALVKIHFPKNDQDIKDAKRRLAFDEMLTLQLENILKKKKWKQGSKSQKFILHGKKLREFSQKLPFTLTDSQKKAAREILLDLKKETAMNRLLQGDVGSGKTVVAAISSYETFLNGFQTALMAPTQILAQQHYKTFKTMLEPFGVKIELIISQKQDARGENFKNTDIIIGTHSLLQETISFKNLGLVIIDEQHRFGVAQRATLLKKNKFTPHTLTMTATPIPRTVALTFYGNLDLSTLYEMPQGRIPIKTWLVPGKKQKAAYEWIRKRIKNTQEQAFIVCPLIEESDKQGMENVAAAEGEFKKLSKEIFPDMKLGLLHGKIKTAEKEKIMEDLKNGRLDILVATPVVEVGIDVPNATIIMVLGAERFGLAQLHQLRGRVGRAKKQSYCLLFTKSNSDNSLSRLKAIEKINSGRKLAELDLKFRGAGEIYGTAQHGFPEFKIASLLDVELIKETGMAAEKIFEDRLAAKHLKFSKKNVVVLN